MANSQDTSEIKKVMDDFDAACEVLKREYLARVQKIMREADTEKLSKLRKELVAAPQ